MLMFSRYLYFHPDDDWSIQSKHRHGFPLSWYQRTLFSVYAGANWKATTLVLNFPEYSCQYKPLATSKACMEFHRSRAAIESARTAPFR